MGILTRQFKKKHRIIFILSTDGRRDYTIHFNDFNAKTLKSHIAYNVAIPVILER